MSNDTRGDELTEEELGEQLDHASAVGRSSAYQHVVYMLSQRAGARFAEGKDEEARLLRALATEINGYPKAQHPGPWSPVRAKGER